VVVRSKDLQPGHPCCRSPSTTRISIRAATSGSDSSAPSESGAVQQNQPGRNIRDIVKYVKVDPALARKAFYSPYLDQSSDPT